MKLALVLVALLLYLVGMGSLVATSIWLYSTLNAPTWVWMCFVGGLLAMMVASAVSQVCK